MSHVLPGSGWPDDPAKPDTPVARTPDEVRRLAGESGELDELAARQSVCRACPRLVEWREEVAEVKRRAFAGETYWGRPVPGWGDDKPRILVVGLAPAAHGGNRTGRIFTGDRSGDWLFASLHRAGLAALETSRHAGDGQRLLGARIAAAVRCAPPANKPTPEERDTCLPWLAREVRLVVGSLRVVVALGGFAWQAVWPALRQAGYAPPRARPRFGHGAEASLGHTGAPPSPVPSPLTSTVPLTAPSAVTLLGCYHPSQQNTFTGRVTAEMLDTVFRRAVELAE